MGGAPEAAPSQLAASLLVLLLSSLSCARLGIPTVSQPACSRFGRLVGLVVPRCVLRPRPPLAASSAALRWQLAASTAAAQPFARVRIRARRAPNAHPTRAQRALVRL